MTTEETHLLNLSTELSESEFSEMISISIICRLCANQSDKLIGIYSEDGVNNDLAGKMNLYLPIKVSESDNLPLQCCWQCASTVLAWHDLVVTSVEADQRLRSYQFVTEKQLEEITSTYGDPDNILTTTADETMTQGTSSDNSLATTKPSRGLSSDSTGITETKTTNELENLSLEAKAKPTVEDISDCQENESSLVNLPKTSSEKVLYLHTPQYNLCADFSTLKCNICKKLFDLKVQLKSHLRTIHSIKVPKIRGKKCEVIRNYTCTWCDNSYTKKHDLGRHLKSKHGQINGNNNRANNRAILEDCQVNGFDNNLYQCDTCSKPFKKAFNLLRHRSIHTNLKAYCCSVCGKSFRLNMSLTRHIKEVHENKRKFECDICKKVFKNKWARDQHLNVHTESRPYVCDICGKSFRQSASLYVHKQYHSSNSPYNCTACDKIFIRKHDLQKHILIHTQQKPHCCENCGAVFTTKHGLNRHTKTHISGVCDKCGCKFEQLRYLKLHRKSCKHSLGSLTDVVETKVLVKME